MNVDGGRGFPGDCLARGTGVSEWRAPRVDPARLRSALLGDWDDGCRLSFGSRVSLCVADNGVGLPEDLDWQDAPSLGLRLVRMLSQQLRGNLEVRRREGGGTEIEVSFENGPGEGARAEPG